eukprot:7235988-Lingulodinium_polyedra.AAC.1
MVPKVCRVSPSEDAHISIQELALQLHFLYGHEVSAEVVAAAIGGAALRRACQVVRSHCQHCQFNAPKPPKWH